LEGDQPTRSGPADVPSRRRRDLCAALAAIAEGRDTADDRALARSAVLPALPWSAETAIAAVPDLVARPAPEAPFAWHIAQLRDALAGAAAQRTRYHARWAWHAIAPEDPRSRPRVSVVIPVFNRARRSVEAVESCLAQSCPPDQIVVADDGSSDDIAAQLARYGELVLLVRSDVNRGPSAARNLALRHATGDLIHFLDSDNLLAADAIAAKLAALLAVPDAALCCSERSIEALDDTAARFELADLALRGAGSPVWDADAMLSAARFPVSSVLIARHLLTEAGGFDERLRAAEDFRLWAILALSGTKVIAIDRQLLRRRLARDGLMLSPPGGQNWAALAFLLNIGDAIAQPRLWRFAWTWLGHLATWPQWSAICDPCNRTAAPFRDHLVAALRALPGGDVGHGLSARPIARVLAGVVRDGAARRPALPFERDLLAALADAEVRGSEPGAVDLARWLRDDLHAQEGPALSCLAAAYDRALTRGDAPVPPDWMLRRVHAASARPYRRRWLVLWLLRKRLGRSAGAPALARAAGVPLLPVIAGRTGRGQDFVVRIAPPIAVDRAAPKDAALLAAACAVARLTEPFAAQYPDQWRGWKALLPAAPAPREAADASLNTCAGRR
jgi:hypothetical protein